MAVEHSMCRWPNNMLGVQGGVVVVTSGEKPMFPRPLCRGVGHLANVQAGKLPQVLDPIPAEVDVPLVQATAARQF